MKRALLLLLVVACGPSSAEIRTAREAHYTAPLSEVFDAVYEATSASYGIADRDDMQGALLTDGKWYGAEGGVEPKVAGSDGQFVGEGSINLSFEVRVQGVEGDWFIDVIPRVLQFVSGSPQPRVIAPDDPAMPGWVRGKIDNLYVAIHGRLAKVSAGSSNPP